MRFSVSPKEDFSNTSVSVIVQDDAETIFFIELPGEQNKIDGWHNVFNLLRQTQPQVLAGLFVALPQLLEIQVDEDANPTYLKMLHALFEWAEEEKHELQEQSSPENGTPDLNDLHQQLQHALFNFEVTISPNKEYYQAIFLNPGQAKQGVSIPRDKFDKSPVQASQATLSKAYESYPEYIEYFINYYSNIQKYVISADQTTLTVFTSLSKALVKLIMQERANLGIYNSHVPDICTFIVKKEPDNEEQKEYLEPILRSFETVEQKFERLNGIISDVKNEIPLRWIARQANQAKKDGETRLMHLISLISADYLKQYDLDSSANFWRRAESRDPVLWFFLFLHRRPFLSLLISIALLVIPSIFAYRYWLTGQPCPLLIGSPDSMLQKACLQSPLGVFSPAFFVILPWYILLLVLLVSIIVQMIRKRWLYSQLLLPRLLGAAVVGLLPLLLNDQTWNIGIESSLFDWGLLALTTYIGSFIYVFIEVHEIKKFIKGHSIAQVLNESLRIFLIALVETLFIVTVTSSLIFPAVISNIGSSTIVNYRFGIYASTPLLSFGFFPSLIVLWTGIALFIGSFVQLIWQGQRITESI